MNSGLPVVSFRLANICGPRLAIGPIPTFYKRLKAGQNCFCSDTIRDFLDMSDFLRLMESSLKENSPLGLFNVQLEWDIQFTMYSLLFVNILK